MCGELRGDVPRRGVVDIVIIGVFVCLVQLLCVCVFMSLVSSECWGHSRLDLAVRCWSLYAPLWLGPSCLDIESEAPLTGDRTVVSGG